MREGGCLCGERQRLTGSAFAIWPIYPQEGVRLPASATCSEHRSDESGRWIRLFFCPRCGTTIFSTWEADPGEVAFLGGTFDDTSWITVDRHVWTRSKQHWFSIPAGAAAFDKSSRAASRPPR